LSVRGIPKRIGRSYERNSMSACSSPPSTAVASTFGREEDGQDHPHLPEAAQRPRSPSRGSGSAWLARTTRARCAARRSSADDLVLAFGENGLDEVAVGVGGLRREGELG
jgi:hypothetical protein